MRAEQAYEELIRRMREEATLASIEALLEWDEETQMPAGAIEGRSEQLALVAGLLHERGTDPRLGELLDAVERSSLLADPEAPRAVNVRELRRDYDRYVRLPRALVQDLARTTSMAQRAWSAARHTADFAGFRPHLEKIVELKRAEAECVGYEREPYDALIDDYEPGITSAIVGRLFDALRRELVPLAAQISSARPRPDIATLRRPVPLEGQRRFAEMVARAAGFEFSRGRLDLGVHPCCTSLGPGDCRIGLRFDLRDFVGGVLTVLHEVGHGLYEQGLDPEHYGLPMGEATSVGMDESQARLWENRVGRSPGFWQHFLPLARERFPDALGDVELDEFHFAVNRVTPSLIRVHADEVTYNIHVMIRFELERALTAGDLAVADLPGAWAEAYQRYLGVTPANDAEGCLQDGHWADGLFGYFPTYTLGDVFGAQFFARAGQDLGDLEDRFARGEFGELVEWLTERIYRQGSRHSSARLVEVVTGHPPDHRPLVEALKTRYGALYDL
jgi:carboxypeptidase Taq